MSGCSIRSSVSTLPLQRIIASPPNPARRASPASGTSGRPVSRWVAGWRHAIGSSGSRDLLLGDGRRVLLERGQRRDAVVLRAEWNADALHEYPTRST